MNPIIKVNSLSKHFRLKVREAGLMHGLGAFFTPKYNLVKAVENISFDVVPGERVAFIGPNGAGKSTTIKMLTGILYPSSGEVSVLEFDPSKKRKQLAMHIGTVFGQRPQLWYHLPAIDTLRFLSRIYQMTSKLFNLRLDQLSEALNLRDLLNVPVRKLSLGQRMRCEIAASLLHHPKIIFLDEPTIGLDVIAKQQIREFIKLLNEQEQTTVFLTSHDPSDIESLAQRTIVINHGQLLFDDSTANFMRSYISTKTVEIILKQAVEDIYVPIGKVVLREPFRIKVEIDINTEPVDQLLSYVVTHFQIKDINIYDPELEEIIRNIYQPRTSSMGA